MTATFTSVRLTCNGHGCSNHIVVTSRTVDSARKAAFAQGWRSTRYPTQDWCPECMERTRAGQAARSEARLP